MQNNYHFLVHLIPAIKARLISLELLSCFSQSKDELVLMFGNPEDEFTIRASLESSFTCLSFPKDFKRAKKNSIDLFEALLDQKVIDVMLHQNERSFHIEFEQGDYLIFQLFGRSSNILWVKNTEVIHGFRSSLDIPGHIDPKKQDRVIEQNKAAFIANGGDTRKVFPTLGPIPTSVLRDSSDGLEAKWQLLSDILKQFEQGNFYLTTIQEVPTFSLLPLGDIHESYSDPIEAINRFYSWSRSTLGYAKLKKQLVAHIKKSINKHSKYILTSEKRLSALNSGASYQQIADIIMANLHTLSQGSTSVELLNFYTNDVIQITLKKDLSPQKNAENYYRKAKNQGKEIAQLEAAIASKKQEIERLNSVFDQVEACDSFKELRKMSATILPSNRVGESPSKETLFKVFEAGGYQILVGRNSKNNDLLTQKHARKDDMWLHAKDVSGSHVVVKQKSGQNFPKFVLETAAAIAAYYSKRKNDSVCPVICTPKKFVRKVKGALPGQVMVDKEDIIIVAPGLP